MREKENMAIEKLMYCEVFYFTYTYQGQNKNPSIDITDLFRSPINVRFSLKVRLIDNKYANSATTTRTVCNSMIKVLETIIMK